MKLRRTKAIDRFLETHKLEISIESNNLGDNWIDHQSAITLGKVVNCPLADLLKGTEVYFDPKPVAPAKTQEYVHLMTRLKKEEEERQYRHMAGLPDCSDKISIQAVTKEVNDQLITIFNIMISIVAVAWAFWYWCSSWPLAMRTLISLFAGIVVAIAEVMVLNGYYRRVNEAQEKARTTIGKSNANKQPIFATENQKVMTITTPKNSNTPHLRSRIIHDKMAN